MEVGHRAEKFGDADLYYKIAVSKDGIATALIDIMACAMFHIAYKGPTQLHKGIFMTQLIGRPNPSLWYIRHCLAYWSNHTKFMCIPFKILTRQLSRIHQDKVTWTFYLTATTLIKEVSKDNWETSRPDDGVSLRKKLKEGWCIVGPT